MKCMCLRNNCEQIKIVFFATRIRRTGPVRQMLSMVQASVAAGFDIRVVTLFDEIPDDSIMDEYLAVLPEVKFKCVGASRLKCFCCERAVAEQAFSDFDPDIIYCLGMPLYALAVKYCRASHVTTLRNYCYEDYPDRYGRVLGALLCARDMRLLLLAKRNPREHIYACSSSISNMYSNNKGIEFPFIRNGVDCDKFQSSSPEEKKAARHSLGISINAKVFVYAAIFNERKNQELILKTIYTSPHFKDCLFVFLGGGVKLDELKSKYGSDRRFIFTGQVPNVAEYLAAADYYITSSISEGLPNGVMEALAAGLPTVMSDIPQHREIANLGRATELFSLTDCTSCADAISRILHRDYGAMSAEARRIAVEELSSQRMASQYLELFINAARDRRVSNG